jgi:hypothetical protein
MGESVVNPSARFSFCSLLMYEPTDHQTALTALMAIEALVNVATTISESRTLSNRRKQ